MEIDCSVGHGIAYYLQDKTFECSDKFNTYICKSCGLVSRYNEEEGINYCNVCKNNTDFSKINIPYASKLVFNEMVGMNIMPRFRTE
jgi:DNA-directed RNA polymerase II subunit RPB2